MRAQVIDLGTRRSAGKPSNLPPQSFSSAPDTLDVICIISSVVATLATLLMIAATFVLLDASA